ncbi:MAG: hypothetical protein AAB637_01870 [Patescibacteria group bacterium]
MDINTQNSSGMMNGLPPINHNEKKVGPIVGALIIVLILIIASLYFFGKKLNTTPPTVEVTPAVTTETPNENVANISSSTSIDSLQADLDAQLNDVDYSF